MSNEDFVLICSQVRKAGENIRGGKAYQKDYETISQWRLAHIYPMTSMVSSIVYRVKKYKMRPLVLARRLKRLQSIELKLRRFTSMRLDRMQDIAGVRIVFKDLAEVMYFDLLLRRSLPRRFKLERVTSYIETPKDDGYRSIHQIFRHASSPRIFLELQIRTQLQHHWATAVEVLGMKSSTKIKQGGGERYYREFFGLCSALFCLKESTPLPLAYKDLTKDQICDRIRQLDVEYNIFKHLSALAISSRAITQDKRIHNNFFIIKLDMSKNTLKIMGYRDFTMAQTQYTTLEIQTRNDETIDVVLISLDKIKQLKSAYPNYYLDCSSFIDVVKKELDSSGLHN